jgi:gluconate 2-dehydrogenase gamma chain
MDSRPWRPSQWSRREFLAGSGGLAGASLWRGGLPALLAVSGAACSARDEGAAFAVLSADEGREIEAIAARILPATDTPGAREAGVVWFFDKSFGSVMSDRLDFARGGLAEFEAGVPAEFPGAQRFSDLDESDQDAWLKAQENTPFFGLVHFMTLCGFFGMSSHGGNRDHVGWQLLGFPTEHHTAWQPPFGYYDAQYMQGESDGE